MCVRVPIPQQLSKTITADLFTFGEQICCQSVKTTMGPPYPCLLNPYQCRRKAERPARAQT